MVRQPDTDFANTLTMLHSTVLHTGTSLQDTIDKSVEKLQASGRAAHDETTRAVIDELSRMRANFREVRDKLSASGETLSTEVHEALSRLRSELRDVRAALANLTAPTPAAPAPATASASVVRGGADIGTDGTASSAGPAPVATLTEDSRGVEDDALHPAIPAQRTATGQEPSPGPALSADTVRQAVRDVLSEELTPLLSQLTDPKERGEATAPAEQQDVTSQLREAAGQAREELSTALEEARVELASLRREITGLVRQEVAGLRTAVEELRPEPAGNAGAVAVEVSKEHGALLRRAARVSSASLLCHRDVWEFITAHAGRHPHFRVPPLVADEGYERIRAALSGRSLIALLISLHSITHTASDGDGDQELATTLYERIEENLTALTPTGQPVTITLDDRSIPTPDTPTPDTPTPDTPTPDTPAAAQDTPPDDEPDAEPEQGTAPSNH